LPSVKKVNNDQEIIREDRPDQMRKIEKSLQMFKKEGSSSKPINLIKEFLPHGSSAKALRDRGEVSSSAKSLGGHSSPILHPNVEELIHEVKVKMETNSHFKGLKNPPKSEIHDFKIQKDRDSLLMKLLEEQRKLRKSSVREKSEIEKRSNLCTLDEKKVDGGGETLLPQATLTVCGGGELYQRTPSLHGGGGEPHLKPSFHMGGELTLDEINILQLMLVFLCFSYYLAPHVFPLILMVLNIMMFFNKNFKKCKKTYETLYQIWSEKSSVHKLNKKEIIRKDISYVTGKDINPFNPYLSLSVQPIYKMSEKSNVPKNSENNTIIKKIENIPKLVNFEETELKNSDYLNQNLFLSCTAEPKMRNEKSHLMVTKIKSSSVAPSSNAENSFLKKWHTRFRHIVPSLTVFS
jgi:hypothetical protein